MRGRKYRSKGRNRTEAVGSLTKNRIEVIMVCAPSLSAPLEISKGNGQQEHKTGSSPNQCEGVPAEQYAVRKARNCDTLGLSCKGRCASCSKRGRFWSQAIEMIVRILRSTVPQEVP